MNRFSRGSIGKSILFNGQWMTPNEFQTISGRKSSKDWKRSIRLRGRCLKEFITQGLFQEHNKSCNCSVCVGEVSEMLRREGVMALAAKRRRLSQADNITPDHSKPVPALPVVEDTKPKPTPSTVPGAPPVKRARGRPRKHPLPPAKIEPKTSSPPSPDVSRIWSPSGGQCTLRLNSLSPHSSFAETGPVADGSSNEEEYQPPSVSETSPAHKVQGVLGESVSE